MKCTQMYVSVCMINILWTRRRRFKTIGSFMHSSIYSQIGHRKLSKDGVSTTICRLYLINLSQWLSQIKGTLDSTGRLHCSALTLHLGLILRIRNLTGPTTYRQNARMDDAPFGHVQVQQKGRGTLHQKLYDGCTPELLD